jgi:hypothetical protein
MFRPVRALPRGEGGRSLSSGRKGLTPNGESRVHIEARKWKEWKEENAEKAIFLIHFMDQQVALYSVQRRGRDVEGTVIVCFKVLLEPT